MIIKLANKLEEEVNIMIRTLYDPEVEKRGIQKGIEQGKIAATLECAKKLLNKLDIEVVKKLREEVSDN